MFDRIKAAPTPVLILFALVLSLEISTFVILPQAGAIVRLVLLSVLMFLTLGGLRIARFILLFLLLAGALFLAVSSQGSMKPVGYKIIFHFLPAALLVSTALYLILSAEFRKFLTKRPGREDRHQSD